MSTIQLDPYLNFDGTADPAIKRYQRALGAEVELVQRGGEAPSGDQLPESFNSAQGA